VGIVVKSKIQQLDYLMIFVLICFMAISTFVIYSATLDTNYNGLHLKHMIMFSAFFVLMILVSLVDYRIMHKYFLYGLYSVGVILLALVEFFGITRNGATRWLEIAGQDFQPSEIVKVIIVIVLAKILSEREGEKLEFLRDIIPAMIIVMVPVLFVLNQPDLATSLIFIVILVGMLWIARIRMIHIAMGMVSCVIFIAFLTGLYYLNQGWFSKIIKPYQMERISTFLNPMGVEAEDFWHVKNSILAISTGGLSGKGFQQGEYVQNSFIPYTYADSIFVVIGEEFGFVGSSILLLLYFVLIYRMILIALNCDDYFGKYIVVGVVTMLTLQIFQNIAMHMGTMPMTGIALPFISYGGSSLLVNMVSIGLVINIKVHSEKMPSLE
jgi:rod shape determining protein RodA